MPNTALLYALGEFFCMAIMLILTGALKPITNYGKREKWLAASLVSETLYFFGDALDKLQMGGVLPASQAVGQLAEKLHGFSCHYGGDEFLAVVRLADDAEAKRVFDDLQEEVKHMANIQGLPVVPQLVTSAVRLDMAEGDLTAQLRIAEEKIYHQKRDLDGEMRENNFSVDKVTGLPNTNYFHSFASSYLKSYLEKGDQPAVVLINISNMQAYNNHYGFEKGDQLLSRIAQILQKFFADGVLVRFAEDNFLLATDAPDLLKSLEEAAAEGDRCQHPGRGLPLQGCQ